jgi:hypothetical protein
MFCLNFLPCVGEMRLVTLNLEASDNHLVSDHVFYPLGAQTMFCENWQFSINSYEFSVRPLTDTLSRSIDGPDMTSCIPIANPCLSCYFQPCLCLLENPLKWLAEKLIQLLKAPNLIGHVLLELSTLCRWKETCDIEFGGLRQRISEYSFFLPNKGLEIVWWNHTVFRSLLRIHCHASDSHSISFNRRPRHDKLNSYCNSVPELLLKDLFEFIEKPLEMAGRRNGSVVKGSISYQTCSAWTFYPVSEKIDLWHWRLRPETTI